MSLLPARLWMLLIPLGLTLGCVGPGTGSSEAGVVIQARYEKKVLTPSGFSGVTTLPARYCFAEVRHATTNALLADGYLGSDGRGSVDLAPGTPFYIRVFASVEVPLTSGSGFFFRGSVLNGAAPAPSASEATRAATFQATPDWTLETNDLVANGSFTADILARAGTADASGGAFAIADQMVTLAQMVRTLEPSLRLPNLHPYWSPTASGAQQQRAYPSVLFNGATPYTLASGRAVFTAALYGQPGGVAYAETDEFDDAVVQETLNHLLFADYSLRGDGTSALSLLRRDNDNVYVSRYRPSESTVGFVGGFSDFLAAAARNDGRLLDSYNDGTGTLQVDTFDLASHSQILSANRGEFTRGSIAISLWGAWKNALGGGDTGLTLLWNAIRSGTNYGDGTGEFNAATLGCYPTYLQGVYTRTTTPQWNAILTELAAESIATPTAAYFNPGTALWLPLTIGATTTGSVQAYAPSLSRYYDRDQAQAYRFTHPGVGTRTVTLTPTGGQDLYLEVLGPGGFVDGSYANLGSVRTLILPGLASGSYAIRVRAGATTSTTSAGYTLTLN